jgi:rhamnulokinase
MGLWMIQSVHKELGDGIDFGQLVELAKKSDYKGIVDVDDSRFFAPDSMVEAVCAVCREGGFDEPKAIGDFAICIYRSLALSYAQTVKDLENLTSKKYDSVNIIGGGSNNMLLNEMTAAACGILVYAGPSEGTALGNIVSQMINLGHLASVEDSRRTIRQSFEIKEIK